MHIKVKGVNNHLVFVLDDNQDFNSLMNELESLLNHHCLKVMAIIRGLFLILKVEF